MSTGQITKKDLENQEDPSELLINSLVEQNNLLIGIQSGSSQVETLWAQGADSNVTAGDNYLNMLSSQMQNLSGDALSKAQGQFQAAQTEVSNADQNYNNVVQGGSSVMNALTQVEAQAIQLGGTAKQNKDNINTLLVGWTP